MEIKAYRMKELTELLKVSKEAVYRWIKQNKFPPPRKVGKRVSIWLHSDIENWLKKTQNKR